MARAPTRQLSPKSAHKPSHLPPQTFPRIGPQAQAAHPRHFPGQKLRLGGDALGAEPTYLLYLSFRSRGELRRIDFAAWPRTRTSRLKLPPESARKPPLHTRGISRARSFDLEVTRWAPTRLTSCISHPGPEESSGASTVEPGPAQPPSASNFPPNRPASLCCTPAAFPGPEASTWR